MTKMKRLVLFCTLVLFPLTIAAVEIGENNFRISDQVGLGDANFDADNPLVAYSSGSNTYLVVWPGDTGVGSEEEIFGQLLDANGDEVIPEFQVSNAGEGEANPETFSAQEVGVAYNSTDDEFLVVWDQDHPTGLDANADHVFGQRIDAATGDKIGDPFLISDETLWARTSDSAVTYNSTDNEYLVVWRGSPTNFDHEIRGQRISPTTGSELAGGNFTVSGMGDGELNPEDFKSYDPAVAYNATDNEYLVTWPGELVSDGRREIFGQRLSGSGVEIGTDDFQISELSSGETTPTDFDNFGARIAYNSKDNEYFVVWEWGETTVDNEIYGQRIQPITGSEKVGTSSFQISDMGSAEAMPKNFNADGAWPVYNVNTDEILIVWNGDESTDEEFEVFGQRVDGSGGPIGSMFQISTMGPDGDVNFTADSPTLAYNSQRNEYLVVWEGDDDTAPLVDDETEIFGQLLAFPSCGDGVTQPDFEECDDGNTVDGDCCAADCTHEASGASCDDGTGTCDGSGACVADDTGSTSGGGCSLIR